MCSGSLRPIQERGHGDDLPDSHAVLALRHQGRSSTSKESGSGSWNLSRGKLPSASNLRSSIWNVSSDNRVDNGTPLSDPQTSASRSVTEIQPRNLHTQQRISQYNPPLTSPAHGLPRDFPVRDSPRASPAPDPPKLSVESALSGKSGRKTVVSMLGWRMIICWRSEQTRPCMLCTLDSYAIADYCALPSV